MAKSGEPLGQYLVEKGAVTEQQLQQALQDQQSSDRRLGKILMDQGYVSEDELVEFLSQQTGYPVVSLSQYPRNPEALQHLSENQAREFNVLPLFVDGDTLILAMSDPLDLVTLDDLEQVIELDVEPVIAPRTELEDYLDRWYGSQDTTADDSPEIRLLTPEEEEGRVIQENAPGDSDRGVAVNLVNRIIDDAITKGATNVHVSPSKEHVDVNFRIDGEVRPQSQLPRRLHQPVMSRFKVLADQYRETQAEQPSYRLIRLKYGDEPVTLRLNTIDTRFGQKLNLKVCRGSNYDRHLSDLGLDVDALEVLERLLSTPRGLLIYTGPSDNGKTTSLYASLRYLSEDPANIITVEHPIEFDLDFCTQLESPEPGPTHHAQKVYDALKVDPDILMVTDMGEPEVAKATLYAAATGRRVLSSYYADNSVDALFHLANTEGVDRYQLANSTVGVVSQRLVRTLDKDCREEYKPSPELLQRFDLPEDQTYYRVQQSEDVDCPFNGVTGIFQVLPMTDDLRLCILEGKPYEAYQEAAQAIQLPTLREKGFQKVLSGVTTIEEIRRVTFREDLTRGLSIGQQ